MLYHNLLSLCHSGVLVSLLVWASDLRNWPALKWNLQVTHIVRQSNGSSVDTYRTMFLYTFLKIIARVSSWDSTLWVRMPSIEGSSGRTQNSQPLIHIHRYWATRHWEVVPMIERSKKMHKNRTIARFEHCSAQKHTSESFCSISTKPRHLVLHDSDNLYNSPSQSSINVPPVSYHHFETSHIYIPFSSIASTGVDCKLSKLASHRMFPFELRNLTHNSTNMSTSRL